MMNTQTTTTPSKHTPGPWITSQGRVPGIGRVLGVLKASHKPSEKDESICVVCKEDKTQPHDIANADLIAAAPEMLEVLLRLNELAKTAATNPVLLTEATFDADEVIAKAQGFRRRNAKQN
jgi:hypothetical protein